jgi:DNA-binding SARP family transcriptional activator
MSDWKYTQAKELVLYLLCHKRATREVIGLEFWPDATTEQVRSRFSAVLSNARAALGKDKDWIVLNDSYYEFNRAWPIWFDVEAFEAAVQEARLALTSAEAKGVVTNLENAVAFYHGDFAQDILNGEWHVPTREHLRQLHLDALMMLGRLHFDNGNYARAVEAYRSVIAKDSLLEAAHREVMRSLARLGERGQAQRHYQSLAALLRDEFGASPAPETTALFERLRRNEDI